MSDSVSRSDGTLDLFLVVAPGLEAMLAEEAREHGFQVTGTTPGGVMLTGDWSQVWRANLVLRGATRVLVRVAAFRAMHLAQLDKRARKLSWSDWLRTDVPVRVEATCRKSRIYHAKAAAQRVERALDAAGIPLKPKAKIALKLRVEDDLATISLDSSGTSLHKRGLKEQVNKAPMRETLAALFLRAAGFTGDGPVYDPMCGSGTFVLEAAEIAAGLQPGRARAFGFQNLATYDQQGFNALRHNIKPAGPVRFFGSDRDAGAVRMSIANAERSGVEAVTAFNMAPIGEVAPPDGPPGLVIVNPPYGGRIGNKGVLHGLYGAFGKAMTERFRGWRVAMVTADAGLAKSTGLHWDAPGPFVDHGGTKIRLWQTQL
ncbi:MAG: class I SAM-dependent RNA methyltransferase [Pseudomonadota bacterium]